MATSKRFSKLKISLAALVALLGITTATVVTPSIASADAGLNRYQCNTSYYQYSKSGYHYYVYCYNAYTGASYSYWY